MEERLDTHLNQADAQAIADGEADGLVGCWLCHGYCEELLVDGLLCERCATVPGVRRIANIHRDCEDILDRIERTRKEHGELMDGIKEAARRTVEAMEEGESA